MNDFILKSNISIIGMPACGKSTLGLLLAKALNMMLIDTDLIIQQKYKKLLCHILDLEGIDEFKSKESKVICSLQCENTFIATGGSVVYSEKAMDHLKHLSAIIFIDLSYKGVEERIADIKSRRVVIENGRTLSELFYERRPLYLKYADITFNADNKGIEELIMDIINQIGANPTKTAVMDGAKFARDNDCDFIVALGGGSVMDAAKAIAMMAANEGDLWDYVIGGTGKGLPMNNEPLPIICITTTAGTGSEADQWGVVTNEETNEKIGVGGYDSLFPVLSIIDPELMKTVPPKFTAYQGFDALFHSTESYISTFASMMSDMYALTAIENVGKYLACAVKNGNDMEARKHMAFANTLSGVVMTVSVTTAEHSLEHAMSAYHPQLPHGAGLIMISKAFYEFFIEKHACDERFIRMAQALGMRDAAKPDDFITMLVNLQEDCGVADLKMSDYGFTPDEFDALARNARETMGGLFAANPYEMTHEDCVRIFEKSYK